MINLAVINIKDIVSIVKKAFFSIIILIILILFCRKFEFNKDIFKDKVIFYKKLINENILISNYYNNNLVKNETRIKKILVSELVLFSTEEKLMEQENQEEFIEISQETENINNEQIIKTNNTEKENIIEGNLNENVQTITNIITDNNIKEVYTNIYKKVKIKNESSYNLTEEMLIPNVEFQDKKYNNLSYTYL